MEDGALQRLTVYQSASESGLWRDLLSSLKKKKKNTRKQNPIPDVKADFMSVFFFEKTTIYHISPIWRDLPWKKLYKKKKLNPLLLI